MISLFYPGLIHRNGDGFGIVFPDLPGCVTVGESLDHLARQAAEALDLHVTGMVEDGETLPEPTPLDLVASDPEYPEIGRLLVAVTPPGRTLRVNITLQEGLLAAIDREASARGMTRSGFLAEAARREMARP